MRSLPILLTCLATRLATLFVLAAAAAGCGDNSSVTGNADMSVPDMAAPLHGDFHPYVGTRFVLPQNAMDFAIDLNGDGRIDNQLGLIINLLHTAGLDLQGGFDQAIQEGSVNVLFSVETADSMLKSDSPVGVFYYIGKTFMGMLARYDSGSPIADGGCAACPDFSGNGMFMVDPAYKPALLVGALASGHFTSENPVTTRSPVSLIVRVYLGPGQPPLNLPINGAHIEFDTGTDVPSGAPGLLNGRVHGSVKNDDVQNAVVPAIATLLTYDLKTFPDASSSMQIENMFDKGKCTNPNGTMATAMDMVIDICEVSMNGLIQTVLHPDVQIYDKNGNYAPSAANADPDSLSVGIGFTAVKGMFPRP